MDRLVSVGRLRLLAAAALAIPCVTLLTNCGGGIGDAGGDLVTGLLSDFTRSISFGEGGFVTQGKFGPTRSADGISFSPVADSAATIDGAFAGGDAVTYGAAGWVATSFGGDEFLSLDSLTWHRTGDLGTSEEILAGAYGAGRYVFVGRGGTIVTLTDAHTWETVASGTSEDLAGVGWVGDGFVAAGASGTVLASKDGIAWEARSVATRSDLRGVAAGEGAIVVTGSKGTILLSLDGGASFSVLARATKADLLGAAFGDGKFVVVGRKATVLLSDDRGASFRAAAVQTGAQPSGMRDLLAVAFGNGRFVAVGEIVLWSDEGSNWQGGASLADAP
jgi:hypothetical protein